MPKLGEGEEFEDSPTPCPDGYEQFCEHGQCEMRHNLPTCRSVGPTGLCAANWWQFKLVFVCLQAAGGTRIRKLRYFVMNTENTNVPKKNPLPNC